MGVAVLIIGAFVAIVGSLMFIGWRYRPPLQLPPRFPEPVELPPAFRRWHIRLTLLRWVILGTGMAAGLALRTAGLRSTGKVVLVCTMAAYGCSIFVSLGLSFHAAYLARRERRARAESPRHSA